MFKFIDLINKKFGRLVVLKKLSTDKYGNYYWLCKCGCGEEKSIRGNSLKSGATQSCGCLQKEIIIERLTKHRHAIREKRSRVYRTWQNMIQRCTNLKHNCYKDYGGRGIQVCKRWRKFENFLEDMGIPENGLTLDRIDNNGNYCKENCSWVTSKQNNRNKRNNHLETYREKTQCLMEWAEEFSINYNTLYKRLCLGWSIAKALTTPIKK